MRPLQMKTLVQLNTDMHNQIMYKTELVYFISCHVRDVFTIKNGIENQMMKCRIKFHSK